MDKITAGFSDSIADSKLDEANKDLEDTISDLGDDTIKQLTKASEDLPVVKYIFTLLKIYKDISGWFLVKKIIRFLHQIEDIPYQQRREFVEDLKSKKKEEIIENLLLVLEKHDHYKKSEIMGKLFRAFILKEITEYDFLQLTHSVSNMNINTLPMLVKFYTVEGEYGMTPELIYSFISLLLIRIDNSLIGTFGGGGPTYEKNRLGMLLVEIGCEIKIPDDYKDVILGKPPKRRT